MHATLNLTQSLHNNNSTTIDPIDAAVAAIDALPLGEHFTYQDYAERFAVSRSTLSRRHRRVTTDRNNKSLQQRKLNAFEEAELVRYIQDLSSRRLSPTRNMIRNFACQIAKDDLSEA